MARLKSNIKGNRSRAGQTVRLQVRHAGAASDQDRGQHGCVARRLATRRSLEHATRIRPRSSVRSRSSPRPRAIANYKIREGYPVGTMVTLRNKQMYEFLDRFVNVALPRVRDFRGISPRGLTVAATSISV